MIVYKKKVVNGKIILLTIATNEVASTYINNKRNKKGEDK